MKEIKEDACQIKFKGLPAVRLFAGGYEAIILPELGSNIISLKNEEKEADIFRSTENISGEELCDDGNREVYGSPYMYLPNRLSDGKLKTTDGEYEFPINEKQQNNYLHGFIHKRKHKVKEIKTGEKTAEATFFYHYNKSDIMYKNFPVEFTFEKKYVISEKGMEMYVTFTNLSDKMFPVGVGSHTSFSNDFAMSKNPFNIRLKADIGDKILLNERFLTSGEIQKLSKYDDCYKEGKINPTVKSIDNDMYFSNKNSDGMNVAELKDIGKGVTVVYETGKEYSFWLFWNEWAEKNYFCVEPMSWMINAPALQFPEKEVSGYREITNNQKFTTYQHIYIK